MIEGLDIGTVVLPDSALKVFLTASPQARATRRSREINPDADQAQIARTRESIEIRDTKDSGREYSPLKPALDAQILDTSDLTLEAVVEQLVDLVRNTYT